MFAAILAVSTRIVEFALGVIAIPRLVSSFGAGLSQAELNVLIEGYRALGAGLLVVIAVFTGIAIALFGVALYRASLCHPVIGGGGIGLGSYMVLAEILSPSVIGLDSLDTPFTVVLWIWLIALGASMIRTTPTPE